MVIEPRDDLELASHRLDDTAECADVHVRTFLELCDRRLANTKFLRELLLRELSGAAQLRQIHRLTQLFCLVSGTRLRLHQFSAHRVREQTRERIQNGADGGTRVTSAFEVSDQPEDVVDSDLVESVLAPSRVIRKGSETVTLVTRRGQTLTGLLAEERP